MERIKLRKLQLDDIDDEYVSWFDNADGHLSYFTGSGRTFSRGVIVDDFHTSVETGQWVYYLIESASGEKIGNVKIGPMDPRNKTSDLVCMVGNRKFLGKGIAKAAISMANQIAFRDYDIRRLQGGMYSGNIPSIKAYTGAGWFVEATMKGFYLVDGQPQDRVCVACLNPKYFPEDA
ncbi:MULTISPECIES: GNAT family N-acetyltransferase [unclassified Pseudomonas]|uniref:GNAT family N-acetyltransferase n=1 Tax=unclassified Pseudomonas TaxID=196821 RepID=UPI0025CB8887|nr:MULTISPECIES: GNAT family protein [unclassified Pseudomonas]